MIICGYFFLPRIMVGMITDYDPYTFEVVFSDKLLMEEYGINENRRPEDYGFSSRELGFESIDGTKLNGWYIPAQKPSGTCLMFIHGRTSNRLKPLKYLALADSLDLDSTYNIFIPDLRNSGKSQEATTYMGYKFAEDVVASMLLMHDEYHQDQFLLYGFSMGAMAILNVIARDDLKSIYQNRIAIEKIIFDSPLVHVKKTLKDQTGNIFMANYFFDEVFDLYSNRINGFGEKMTLSHLLDPEIPTLILQSKNDSTTKADILESELGNLKNCEHLHVHYFDGPGHVKIFQDESTKMEYVHRVSTFVR